MVLSPPQAPASSAYDLSREAFLATLEPNLFLPPEILLACSTPDPADLSSLPLHPRNLAREAVKRALPALAEHHKNLSAFFRSRTLQFLEDDASISCRLLPVAELELLRQELTQYDEPSRADRRALIAAVRHFTAALGPDQAGPRPDQLDAMLAARLNLAPAPTPAEFLSHRVRARYKDIALRTYHKAAERAAARNQAIKAAALGPKPLLMFPQ